MTADSFSGRVLLVDDLEINQIVGAGMLKHLGVPVDIASGGAEALEMLDAGVYDLVLMDIHMPDMDGLEVTRRIRAREAADGSDPVPIMALTAVSKDEDMQACADAGMDGHIGKPLLRDRLIEVLECYLGGHHTGDAPSAVSLDGRFVAVVDKERFDSLCETMGSIENGVSDVLADYLESVPRLNHDIADGLATGETEKLTRAAHSLKSNSLTVGALALAELCRQVEAAGRDGQTDGCGELLEQIRSEFDSIRPGLQNMMDSWRTSR